MDRFLEKPQELRRRICEEAEAELNLPAASLGEISGYAGY